MACGCGKKVARPATRNVNTVASTSSNQPRVATAKTYQSATMRRAPSAPVATRKTV